MDKKQSFLAELIKNAALIDNPTEFKQEAKKHSIQKWINIHKAKVAAVGAGTGLLGGPWGLALEAADIGYLGSIMGRLCFGIGHIKNKPVNYDYDMEGILAIWGGVGKAINKDKLKQRFKEKYKNEIEKNYRIYLKEFNNTTAKINKKKTLIQKLFSIFKKSNKANYLSKVEFENILFNEYLKEIRVDKKFLINDNSFTVDNNVRGILFASTKILAKTSVKMSTKVGLKVGSKIIAKKLGVKIPPKILSKAAAKLSAKATGKISTKWIPIIGGVVSAGVNVWVLDGIAETAKNYYESDYILISSEVSDEILQEISDMESDIKEHARDEVKNKIELIFDD